MTRRALIGIPFLVAILYLVAQALVPIGPTRDLFFSSEVAFAKLLGAIGCFLAASKFRKGQYLWVAWSLLGVDYLLLLVKDLLFGKTFHFAGLPPASAATVRAVFVISANASAAVGSIMLARAWAVAGIALPGSKTSQRLVQGLAIVVAVTLVGSGVWRDGHQLSDREALIAVASSIGDVVSFSVIAPLLLTALAMRGGALVWPWAFLTASNVAWLIYDMVWSFERQFGMAEPTLRTIEELWRAVACALALAAGIAQRWSIRSRPASDK